MFEAGFNYILSKSLMNTRTKKQSTLCVGCFFCFGEWNSRTVEYPYNQADRKEKIYLPFFHIHSQSFMNEYIH